MAWKVLLQIKTCFCCSLTVATILIAIYTVLFYSLLVGLAGWGLTDTTENGDNLRSNYDTCLKEARGEISAENRKLKFRDGATTIVIEDSSSYHCSLGLYTEELKHPAESRYILLVFNLLVYVLLIIAAILVIVSIGMYVEWLLLPWICLMIVDVLRGIVSILFIFVYSHGYLARIAVGIFFLGVQFFHISLVMVIVAKFQRMHDKKRGIDYKSHPQGEKIMPDGSRVYPTLPSNYQYQTGSPGTHRDGFYQPTANYSTADRRFRADDDIDGAYQRSYEDVAYRSDPAKL